jgi:hypothetical protein
MPSLDKPDGWTDEQFAAYFGRPDDPIVDAAEIGGMDTVDVPEIADSEGGAE